MGNHLASLVTVATYAPWVRVGTRYIVVASECNEETLQGNSHDDGSPPCYHDFEGRRDGSYRDALT